MTSYLHPCSSRRLLCAALLSLLLPLVLPSQEPQEPKPVKKVLPLYPDVLKHAGISGTVRVRAIIGPDGTVKDVTPMGGSPVFIDAVIKAVKQWRFPPTGEHQRLAEISVSFECCSTVTTIP